MASLTPPPGIDLKADHGPRIISTGIALIILPTIFVILRFVSRQIANAGLWWDDVFVVISLLLSYGPNIAMIVSAKINKFGEHLWALPDPEQNTTVFLKILYIYIIFYYAAVTAIKLAILLFYRRIFPVTEIRIWLYIGYGLVGCYAIATLASTTFQCQPIHGFWNKDIPFHCVSGDNILVVPGAVNAVLDGFVIFVPLPLLWRLRTSTQQKGILTGIFALGGFVCVISIIRLVVLSRLHEYDVTWNFVNAAIWSAAEPSMGVIAACIPSLRPLVALLWKGTYRGPTMPSSGKGSEQATTSASSGSSRMIWPVRTKEDVQPAGGFTRLEDPINPGKRDRWGHETEARGGKPGGGTDEISLEEMNAGDRRIKVKEEVTVTSYAWDYKDRLY